MDAGKIITQGSPDELLKKRYDGLIIELPISDLTDDLSGIEHTVLENLGIIEVFQADAIVVIERIINRIDSGAVRFIGDAMGTVRFRTSFNPELILQRRDEGI